MEQLVLVVTPATVGPGTREPPPLPEDAVVVGVATAVVQGQVVATNGLTEGRPGHATVATGAARVAVGRKA